MQKFAFLNSELEYLAGREIRILSKYTYQTPVVIQLQSSYAELHDKSYKIDSNNLIVKFQPTQSGWIKAVRVWGAVWDTESALDINIKLKSFDKTIEVSQPLVQNTEPSKIKYDIKGWSETESHLNLNDSCSELTFYLREKSDKIIDISCNDSEIKVLTPRINFDLVTEKYIEITNAEIEELLVITEIQLSDNYKLQGSQNIKELYYELKSLRLNLECNLTENSLIIKNKNNENLKIKFVGLTKNFIKNYSCSRIDPKEVKIKLLSSNFSTKSFELNLSSNYEKIKNPTLKVFLTNKESNKKLIINYPNKVSVNSLFQVTSEQLLQFKNCDLLNLVQEFNYYRYDLTTADIKNIEIFNQNDKLSEILVVQEIAEIKLSYNKKIFRDYAYIEFELSNKPIKKMIYDIQIVDDLSKSDIDFKLSNNQLKFEVNQTKTRLDIRWLSLKPYRKFKLSVLDQEIDIDFYDTEKLPSSIISRKDKKHSLNLAIDVELRLEYLDNFVILPANQKDFTITSSEKELTWKVYLKDHLLFQQNISYFLDTKVSAHLEYETKMNRKNHNIVTIRLDHIDKKENWIELKSNSNTNCNIDNRYFIPVGQTELMIHIPIELEDKLTILNFQVIDSSLLIDSNIHTVIIS